MTNQKSKEKMKKTNNPLTRAEIASMAGKQAAKNMTPEQRSDRARKGGTAMWKKMRNLTKLAKQSRM